MAGDRSANKASGQTGKGGMVRCLNLKVIAGLAAAGLAIWAVAPNTGLGFLPFLLILACPLSMWFMMRGMSGMNRAGGSEPARTTGRTPANAALPGESLTELKARLARLDAEKEAISDALSLREADKAVTQKQRAAGNGR